MKLYKFDNIKKQLIWGCEEWVLSSVPESESKAILPEEEKGMTLAQLINRYGEQFTGKKNFEKYGAEFPLLVKFISAQQDLSIQVHPSDEYARKNHNSLGKTEMWYILEADADASVRAGFNRTITPEEYEQHIKDSTILDVLNDVPVKKGDVIYLPAGRVHSMGAGISLLEVQETSNITYRIFDYNRTDAEGNLRELHTQRAKEVLDYEALEDCKTHYTTAPNAEAPLVDSPFFTTSLMTYNTPQTMDYSGLDSFVLYMCTKGSAVLTTGDGGQMTMNEHDVIFIPAAIESIRIEPNGEVEIFKTYIDN